MSTSSRVEGSEPGGSLGIWLSAAAGIVTIVALALLYSPPEFAAAQGGGEGATIYADKCASCHQADGSGVPGSFPPLRGNPNVADVAYVESVISDGLSGPLEVDGVTYDGVMPAIDLSDAERTAVAEYVASLAEAGESTAPTTAPPEPGEPGAGRSLFEGGTRFENGAAACVSCHTAGNVGSFGGPTLGPDLTDVYERLGGEAGLAAWLVSPPSPTMTPIFEERPLTDAEIADVVAFLGVVPDEQKASSPVDWMVVGGLAGVAVFLAAMAVAYQGMRQTYVERLRSKP
jgi:mono/diheme cytochrome c family protein